MKSSKVVSQDLSIRYAGRIFFQRHIVHVISRFFELSRY